MKPKYRYSNSPGTGRTVSDASPFSTTSEELQSNISTTPNLTTNIDATDYINTRKSKKSKINYSTGNLNENNQNNQKKDKQRRQRRRHKNSHTGCKNCKKRRIKCDENKISCQNCVKSNSHCSYLNDVEIEIPMFIPSNGYYPPDQNMVGPEGSYMPSNGMVYDSGIQPLIPVNSAYQNQNNLGIIPQPPLTNTEYENQYFVPQNIHPLPSSYLNTSVDVPQYIEQIQNNETKQLDSTHNIPQQMTQLQPVPVDHNDQSREEEEEDDDYDDDDKFLCGPGNRNMQIFDPIVIPPMEMPEVDFQDSNLIDQRIKVVQTGFDSDSMRATYEGWMGRNFKQAFTCPQLFHSILSLSITYLSIKTNDDTLLEDSGNERALALESMRKGLSFDLIDSVSCGDAYLAASLLLSWDILSQPGSNPETYITFAKGMTAILQQVESVESKGTTTSKCVSESLLQTFKSIYFPGYEPFFIQEVIEELENTYDFLVSGNDQTLISLYYELLDFLKEINSFFKTTTRHDDRITIYSPSALYRYLNKWITIIPSRANNLDAKGMKFSLQERVLYMFYHTITKGLDAIFPEVRYLYQVGFVGPIGVISVNYQDFLNDSYNFNNNVNPADTYIQIQEYIKFIDYPLKLFLYFTKRLQNLNIIFTNFNPFKLHSLNDFEKLKFKSRRQMININEIMIKSFKNINLDILLKEEGDYYYLPKGDKPLNEIEKPVYSDFLDGEVLQKYYIDRMSIVDIFLKNEKKEEESISSNNETLSSNIDYHNQNINTNTHINNDILNTNPRSSSSSASIIDHSCSPSSIASTINNTTIDATKQYLSPALSGKNFDYNMQPSFKENNNEFGNSPLTLTNLSNSYE